MTMSYLSVDIDSEKKPAEDNVYWLVELRWKPISGTDGQSKVFARAVKPRFQRSNPHKSVRDTTLILHSPWYANLPWQAPTVCDSAIGKSTREIQCQCGASWHSHQIASMNWFVFSVKVNNGGTADIFSY